LYNVKAQPTLIKNGLSTIGRKERLPCVKSLHGCHSLFNGVILKSNICIVRFYFSHCSGVVILFVECRCTCFLSRVFGTSFWSMVRDARAEWHPRDSYAAVLWHLIVNKISLLSNFQILTTLRTQNTICKRVLVAQQQYTNSKF